MLSYEALKLIWWVLLGILLIGFAITDGFDLGIGILLPLIAKNNIEKRVVINTIGPVWEGNQTWIILGAGAIFAAWPAIYGVAFSSFYLAMFLALTGFILRPVGFKYRSKIDNSRWRFIWDCALFLGGFLPALIFGVAIGNVLQGIPFYFDDTLRQFYTGSFWQLLNPFALLCGFTSIVMLTMHGSLFLVLKTEEPINMRAVNYARISALLLIIAFAVAGLWLAFAISGYVITSPIAPNEPANPIYKTVVMQTGAWLHNYRIYPVTLLAPIFGFLGAVWVLFFTRIKNSGFSFFMSSVAITGIISSVGISMFPFLLPSSSNLNSSLTVWDASSSQLTLFIMLIATAIFLPLILIYTSWVYRVLKGKVTVQYVTDNKQSTY